MARQVKYKELLELGDEIKVTKTSHEAKISEIIGKPDLLHCVCYRIKPEDPKGFKGEWYFSHDFILR